MNSNEFLTIVSQATVEFLSCSNILSKTTDRRSWVVAKVQQQLVAVKFCAKLAQIN